MNKQEFFIKRIESTIVSCKESMDKFIEKLKEDPAYALSWGTSSFQTAANLKVYSMVLVALNDGSTMEQIKSSLMDRVLNKAKYPPQSTSPCSNLMEQYELAAYAEILSEINTYM